MARTTVKQLLQTKQMRLIQERLSKGVLTFKDLKALSHATMIGPRCLP